MLDPSKACGSDVGAVLGRVWQILRRCGAWLLAEPWRRPEDARLAAELRHGLVDLGPSFVRLGRRWGFPNGWGYPNSWMVYNGKSYFSVDDKWGTPIYGNPQMVFLCPKKVGRGGVWCHDVSCIQNMTMGVMIRV